MTMSTTLNPTERFSDRVRDYIRYRPGYPPELLAAMADEMGLRADHVVADVGSGTGILSALLLENGNTVYGVEPNAAMRAAAEELLADLPRFHSVNGTAEATTLPDASVDHVTAAQAYHWFDPERARAEFARILRPGGCVALVWNNRLTTGSPFLEAYEELLVQYADDYTQVNHRSAATNDIDGLRAFFAPNPMTRLMVARHVQAFDYEGFCGRVLSSSYVPQVGRPGHEALMGALMAVFDRFHNGGYVYFIYETDLYYGTLDAGR